MAVTFQRPLRLMVIEDDYVWALSVAAAFRETFHEPQVVIVNTAHAFLSNTEDLANAPPDLLVTDMRLRWCDVGDERGMAAGKDVNVHRAGIACIRAARSFESMKTMPIVVHSMISRSDLSADSDILDDMNIAYSDKENGIQSLVLHVRSLLAATGDLSPPSKKFGQRIWDAVDLSIGVGGIHFDLKKLFS